MKTGLSPLACQPTLGHEFPILTESKETWYNRLQILWNVSSCRDFER